MTTTRTIQERVAAGAAALDAEMPDWVGHIDLDTLRMDHNCDCVLGHAFGDYFGAPFGDEFDSPDLYKASLGFQAYAALIDDSSKSVNEAIVEYADLQAEWTRLIEARRAKSGAR